MKTLVIAEINKVKTPIFLINYQPGIWWGKLTLTADEKAASPIVAILGGSLDDYNETPLTISSLNIGITRYNLVNYIADLYSQATSFYWDNANQTIYVRTDNPYWIYGTVSAGVIRSFIDKLQYDTSGFATELTENYEPRLLLDSIDMNESLDPSEYGIFRYDSMQVEIDNSDGTYDNIESESAGQGMRILYGHCEDDKDITIDDLQIIRSGYVEHIEFNGFDTVTITGKDKRKKWSDKIGTSILNTTDFPTLPDNAVDKRKPICLGQCFNVPCVQVNGSSQFMFSDADILGTSVTIGGTSVSAVFKVDNVYVDGVSAVFTGGSNGLFVQTGYTTGKVTADVNSTCTLTDVEKILLLLSHFQNISFLDSNFDLAEVTAANALSTTGGIYISQNGEALNKVIEQLLVNIGGWLLQKGEVFTIRLYNKNRASIRDVEYDELAGPPQWYFDEEQFVSSVTVGYHKDEAEKEYLSVYDNSLEADAIANQYRLNNKVIETTIISDTEAAATGLTYYERFAEVPRTIQLGVITDISELYPSDVIAFELKRLNAMSNTGVIAEKIIADRANYMITDIDKINRSITAQYLIDNPSVEFSYTQGYLYNDVLYSDALTV